MENMSFSKLLIKYRTRRNYTKSALAERIGFSATYISQFENENRIPPQETCEKLATALGLSETEKQELFSAALYERTKDRDKAYKDILGLKADILGGHTIKNVIRSPIIPVVSYARASDDNGFEFEPIEPHEYKKIDFTGCKAVEITSNSMAPVAFKGQSIIYSETRPIKDGCLAYIKLKSGESYFKRFTRDDKKKIIVLESVNNTNHKALIIGDEDVDFCFKVVGVAF